MDQETGEEVGQEATSTEVDLCDAVVTAGLDEFFRRPVRILNFDWNMSDPAGQKTSCLPWNLYFTNASIKRKLDNYAFLRGNLRVKVVVNASPFFYGSMRMSYWPLATFKSNTIQNGTVAGQTNSEFIPLSQLPGVWIKPQCSEGAEMTLPFIFHRNYLRVQVADDFGAMGTLRFHIYSALQSANGVASQSVSVQVYAWVEGLVLAGPTAGLSLQADEYGVGPVSGPASTVASIASKLKSVPVIGKFATATEMGAKAVSGIAKLFGFTNVPVISPTEPYRPAPFPQFASPEIGFPVEKLTMDAKNELSVDPTIIGLPPEDELTIQSMAMRQSFISKANWSTSDGVDKALFTSRVTPSMTLADSGSNALIQTTPLGLLSQLMACWRGDVIFTFRFIASPFHKGRVRISYDPYGQGLLSVADTGPVVFNKIVDLAHETEVDVRVPYQQALAWCYTDSSLSTDVWSTADPPLLVYKDTFDNGLITVRVLTRLTAPVASSNIDMQVFVRGADNFEFANPITVRQNTTPFALQSEEYQETRQGMETSVGSNTADMSVVRSRLHFGENVKSLRSLLRRSNLVDVFNPRNTVGEVGVFRLNQTRFPPHYGFDPKGYSTCKGVLTPGSTYPFNYAYTTPWHLISNCFLLQRGSMHWHYNWVSKDPVTLRVMRNNQAVTFYSSAVLTASPGTSNDTQWTYMKDLVATTAGLSVTNQHTNAGLSISIPNYNAFKFQSTDIANSTGPVTSTSRYDGSVYDSVSVVIVIDKDTDLSTGHLERYFAAGTDYGLYFFMNCPSRREILPGDINPS
nr:MAG: structural polyprotein [Marnaviridae sp.]